MAELLSCIVCGGKVSSDAATCPHCGTKNFAPPKTKTIDILCKWPEQLVTKWNHRQEWGSDIHINYSSSTGQSGQLSCEWNGRITVPSNCQSLRLHLDLVEEHYRRTNMYTAAETSKHYVEKLSSYDASIGLLKNTQLITVYVSKHSETVTYEKKAFRIGGIGIGKTKTESYTIDKYKISKVIAE